MANTKVVWFIIYLIFALYFVNSGLSLVTMPAAIQSIHNWIVLIGGVLILIGGINHYRASRLRF